MRVAAVLVNYGQWELTRQSIESLERSEGVDVTVTLVDNGSPGEVPEWVGRCKDLRFLRLQENTGFAGGNNRGFEASLEDEAEFTFFLNNDAEVFPDTVAGLAGHLREEPGTGIAAPAIYWKSDPDRLWGAGGRLVRWKMRYEQVELPEGNGKTPGALEVDFVSGCAMMARTGMLKRIGGFREDFFMYYEDADLCRRVIEMGFRVEVLPGLRVLHSVGSSSGGQLSKLAIYFSDRNRFVLARDLLSPFHRAVFLIYKTAVNLVITVKFLAWQGPSLIPWLWRGYLHGIAGRTGYRDVIGRLV